MGRVPAEVPEFAKQGCPAFPGANAPCSYVPVFALNWPQKPLEWHDSAFGDTIREPV